MITPTAQTSLANAKKYFREHLRVGDYYSQDESIEGEWFGEGAKRLELSGKVAEKDFVAMCQGNNPKSGELLTQRKNSTRNEDGKNLANRRVFYDFVFRPPKSVSIVAYLSDERIVKLHRESVKTALRSLEKYAETRVRLDGACTDRRTGNIVAALFEHDTSREQDPLLHTHAVAFNATFDAVEDRWKALQSREMFKALSYADAVYNQEMTRELIRLGYRVDQHGKSWEIAGISRDLIERFSKRRAQIEKRVAEEMAKPGNANADRHQVRERIAREERKRKIRGADKQALRAKWRSELGADGARMIAAVKPAARAVLGTLPRADYAAAVAWGKSFVFERKSVVRVHELIAAAARRIVGFDATIEELTRQIYRAGIVREEDGERVASVEGLRREWAIVERAKHERGRHRPLVGAPDLSGSSLDAEQRAAVVRLLTSRDGVTIFRGAAGTGKSTTLRELNGQLKAAGVKVVVAAPQAKQARNLECDGLPAVTLAKLLQTGELPLGAVVLVDEAGQVGGRQMEALFDLARRHAARLILSGDTRQHPSVEASDAMRALESFAGVTTAEIRRVRRQDPKLGQTAAERATITAYRGAVEAAADGQAVPALSLLLAAGCVENLAGRDLIAAAAAEYERQHAAGLRVLAVSQTRAMVRDLNAAIVERLEARGEVREVREVLSLAPRDVHVAEKELPETYTPGTVLRLVRDYGTLRRGDLVKVDGIKGGSLLVRDVDGHARRASLAYRDRWELLEEHTLRVGIGSVLQLRANGVCVAGKKIVNGELVRVTGFEDDGTIRVRDLAGVEKRLGHSQRVMQLGYAVTSYGSQGETVDAIILADAGVAAATNKKQWYVSISRARRRISVFTHDARELAQRIAASGDRMLALELPAKRAIQVARRSIVQRIVRRVRVTAAVVRRRVKISV